MQNHDKLSFREEIKTYVRLAMNSTETRTLEDVVEMLKKIYLMDIRLKGNTISYALPYHAGETGKAQAVRGSKLGSRFTVAGIRQYMQEKEQKQVEYRRTMKDIEEAKPYIDDYGEWNEKPEKKSDKDRCLIYIRDGNQCIERLFSNIRSKNIITKKSNHKT